MSRMLEGSSFNGDISKWNISNVTDMHKMFFHSKFNKFNIGKWNIRPDCNTKDMFKKDPE
jgi:surface protein